MSPVERLPHGMERFSFEGGYFALTAIFPIHHMILLVWQISPFQPYGVVQTDQATRVSRPAEPTSERKDGLIAVKVDWRSFPSKFHRGIGLSKGTSAVGMRT